MKHPFLRSTAHFALFTLKSSHGGRGGCVVVFGVFAPSSLEFWGWPIAVPLDFEYWEDSAETGDKFQAEFPVACFLSLVLQPLGDAVCCLISLQ